MDMDVRRAGLANQILSKLVIPQRSRVKTDSALHQFKERASRLGLCVW